MDPDEARQLMMRYGLLGAMTRRQEQIVGMLAEGAMVEQIAGELGINPKSVEAQLWRAGFEIRLYELRKQRERGA
jgi:DNA-binding NarL/FixJ family response regulator